MIGLACLIPIAACIALLVQYARQDLSKPEFRGFFKFKRIEIWEIFAPLVVIPLVFGAHFITESAMTTDTEYWGAYATKVQYFEDWDQEVPCRHTKYCTRSKTCQDSNGNSYSCDETYACGTEHAYDVDFHPARWNLEDSNGADHGISQGRYVQIKNKWVNEQFIDLHRVYHSNDGDLYQSDYSGNENDLIPVITTHSYENRVAVSDSVFNFPEVADKNIKEFLIDYPKVNDLYVPSILFKKNDTKKIKNYELGYHKLDVLNATLGRKKQVRVWLLVFPNDAHSQEALLQESYWKRGNKNELVICISLSDEGYVNWAYVFSWMKSVELGIEIRDLLQTEYAKTPLDLLEFSTALHSKVQKQFVRRPFKEFEYLSVEPPFWAVCLVWFLSFTISVGIFIWVREN